MANFSVGRSAGLGSGHVTKTLVFLNRSCNRVKLLYWDGTGLWILAKRLERGRFCHPRSLAGDAAKMPLKPETLEMLLSGIDLKDGMQRIWYGLPDK